MNQIAISLGTQIEAVRDEIERHNMQLVLTPGSKREAKKYLIARLQAAVQTLETVKDKGAA